MKSEKSKSIKLIFHYWLKSKKEFILSFIYQLISTVFAVFIPIFTGILVGSVLIKNPDLVRDLLFPFFTIVIISLLVYFLGTLGRLNGARASSRATFYMRRDINDNIYKQSFSYFDKHITGKLIAIATSDVEQTTQLFGFGLSMGMQSFTRIIGTYISTIIIGIAFGMPLLSLIFGIFIPMAFIAKIIITNKLKPIFLEQRQSFAEITNNIFENIIGADVVRIFSKQEKENLKFQKNNRRFYDSTISSVKYSNLLVVVNSVLTGILTISSLIIGGSMYDPENLATFSIIITYISYVAQVLFPLGMFGQILLSFIQADAALSRIREILEAVPDVKEKADAISIEGEIQGNVEFKNVSFGYLSSQKILDNINFKIDAGKTCAIMGTTGSGKSTIINLLPRFYDVVDGEILIDGIDVRDYKLKDLRKSIGVVGQESFLFNKSIKENIAYGKDEINEEEIINAAKISQLHDFITSLPNGYDSMVGERGMRLSGGQKQRLSIARALIIKPKILIFDDSTSSVDVETEFRIQKALETIMNSTTSFIITQRISTIRNADVILVLDKGRIVGFGNHFELIKSNVLYRQIYETLYKKQIIDTPQGELKVQTLSKL
ncbi:MAG: ABC transporter ATP-binding protein [Promethearchaeota archaeon]